MNDKNYKSPECVVSQTIMLYVLCSSNLSGELEGTEFIDWE